MAPSARRIVAISAVIVALLAVAVSVVLHLPSVRERLFDAASRLLASRYGLELDAARLDYNLITGRVTLTDVRLAASGHEQDPFLTAARVEVELPWSILRGAFALDRVALTDASVSMLRYEDGSSNLPASGDARDPSLPPLRFDVGAAAIDGLDFLYDDRVRGMRIAAGDLHADLSRGRVDELPGISGPIEIPSGVHLTFGEREITADPIAGTLAFDGSNAYLKDVALKTAEGQLTIGGRIERVLDRPGLDLQFTGAANVARAAEWGTVPVKLGGTAQLTGTISGAAAEPTIAFETTSSTLDVGRASDVTASSHVTVTTSKLVIDEASVSARGGSLETSATIPFSSTEPTTATASWRGFDLRTVLALAGQPDRPISALITGSLQYERLANGPPSVHIENRSSPAPSPSTPSVPLAGELTFQLVEGRWYVRQHHSIPGAIAIEGELGGSIDGTAVATATVDSLLDATIDDIARTTTAVERLGLALPAIASRIGGTAQAQVTLAGRVDALETSSIVEGQQITLPGVAPQAMYAEVATSPSTVSVSNVTTTAGDARLSGNAAIDVETERLSGAFELNAPDVAALLADLPSGLTVRGPVEARATLGGTTSAPEVVVDASGQGLDVSGQPIDALSAHALITGDRIAVESFEIDQRDGSLTGSGSYGWQDGSYTADVNGSNLSWTGPLIGSTESTVRLTTLRYAGAGTVEQPGGEATAAFEIAGGVAGTLVGEGTANARFTGDTAMVMARVPALGAFVDSRIATDAPYRYDAVAVINRIDLAALAPLAGTPEGAIGGTISLSATSSGTITDPVDSRAFVNLQGVQADVNGVPITLAGPSRLAWENATLTIDALELTVGQGRLSASGALARAAGTDRWDASFEGELADLFRMSHAFGAPADLEGNGSVTARWESTGGLGESTGSLAVNGGTISWGRIPPIDALTVQAAFDRDTITLSTLTGTWQGGGIEGSATIPRALVDTSVPRGATEPGHAALRVTKLGAAAFEPWLGSETSRRIKGELSARLDAEILGSRLEDVRAALVFDEASFTMASVEVVQTRPTTITLDYGIITMEDVAWTFGGSPLLLTGRVTLDPELPPLLDLAFAGDMDLRVLAAFSPTIVTEGAATVDIWASGSGADPELTGILDLKEAGVALREPRIVLGQVNGPVVVEDGVIRFAGVTGVANGGDLLLDGRLGLDGMSISGGQLVAQLRGAALEFPENLQSEINALVTLTPEEDEWVLGGDVRIVRSSYTEPVSIAALLASRQSRPPIATSDGRSWRDQVRLNLFVVTEEDLRVDNNYGRLEAGIAVRLVGTVADPGLTGRVTLREGGQFYLAGNTFYIERGSVSFTSPTRIEPEIDLQARGVAGGSDLRLTLSGTPDRLQTNVSSTDPAAGLTDEEARSRLMGGLVGDEQALALLSGELLGVTGRALGLDSLRLDRGFDDYELRADPTLIATETDPSTRLTLSKHLRPEIELIVSQSLSESGALSAIVSYKPRRNIEIRASSRDNIDRSIAVRHEITFGGGGTTSTTASMQPRISEVLISGHPGRPEAAIRSELELEAGSRFDFHRWQEDIDEVRDDYLVEGYYEARVRGTREESPDGSTVALHYDIERGPRTRLVVEGHRLSDTLMGELEEAWTRMIFDRFLLDEIDSRIRRGLLAENWIGTTVDAKVTVSTPEEKEVRVTVSPGTHVSERTLRFSGNSAIEGDVLEDVVARAGLTIDGWLDPPSIATAIEAFYREMGYLAVEVEPDEPTVDGDIGVLPVKISEGPQYTIGTLTVSGASEGRQPVAENAMEELAAGAPYERAAVDRVAREIERRYLRRGFNEVRVEPQANVDGFAVDITFNVEEGMQQVLRDITTEGVVKTKSGVVRRALRLRVGQPVDLERWAESRKRMYDTNVFREVDIEPVKMEPTADDRESNIQPIRAVVRVAEYPTWRLRYGAQYREERTDEEAASGTTSSGFGVLGDLQNQNLFGRAVTGGVAVSYQPDRQATSIYASNASFFTLPIRSNLFVFGVRERDQPIDVFETQTDRRGVSFEQRWRPFRRAEVTYGYRYEWTHLFQVDPPPGTNFLDEYIKTGRLRSGMFFDRRDDPFNATRGWFSSVNYDKASPFLGADFPYSKLLVQQFYYRKVGAVVLASAARIGVAYQVDNIDYDNRFFAGGGTTVRGYREDALGPLDFTDRPRGGGSLLILNQELRFPISRWFSGVAFIDGGNVWATRDELSIRDLKVGYGLGLRLNTPFALLRVDYGIPGSHLRPGSGIGVANGRWYFGIGQIF